MEGYAGNYSKEKIKGFYENFLNGLLSECYVTGKEKIENKHKYKFAPGAEKLMGKEGRLKILQGEDSELNAIAYENSKKDKNHPSIFDPREDFFIVKGIETENPLIVGIYGRAHSFKNNVDKHNLDNPNKKISLVEIIPKSFIE